MRINRETKIGLAALAMVVVVATTIAAVPGIFSSVNSTSGYQVAGSAGSSGQALCSDGTYYDLPCSVAGGFTAAGDLSGSSSSQNVVGIATHALPSLATGYLNWTGSAWAYTAIIPRTCNGNGCYSEGPDGVIHEWAQISGVPTGTGANYTLPFTFPNACEGVNATDNGGASIGSNPRSIGSGCVSSSQIWLVASGTPSGTTFYEATGH